MALDLGRLWNHWIELLRMSRTQRKLEGVVRALATVDMAMRRVRTKKSRQKSITVWIAAVEQSNVLKTADGALAIYEELEIVIEGCGLHIQYLEARPQVHRQRHLIAVGAIITGRFRKVDLKSFRKSRSQIQAALREYCKLDQV